MCAKIASIRITKSITTIFTQFLALLLVSTTLLFSCRPLLMSSTTGSMTVSIRLAESVQNAEIYELSGSRPGSSFFKRIVEQMQTTVTHLIPGPWRLYATAIDVYGNRVGEGSASAESVVGETTHATILIEPFIPVIGYELIEVVGSEFVLEWDAPVSGNTVDSFNVYYRIHGDIDWIILRNVPASTTPSLTVSRVDLTHGVYDFAVTSVDVMGNESDMHTSFDSTAYPATGWFLDWKP